MIFSEARSKSHHESKGVTFSEPLKSNNISDLQIQIDSNISPGPPALSQQQQRHRVTPIKTPSPNTTRTDADDDALSAYEDSPSQGLKNKTTQNNHDNNDSSTSNNVSKSNNNGNNNCNNNINNCRFGSMRDHSRKY